MNDAVSVLSGGGFDNADSLVRAATDSGLPLGIAAALVAKESMGANVYGHDAGGAMQGAGEVTRNNYYSGFLPVIQAGGTSNGVGPCQITYPGYFTSDPDYAWWDPYYNMLFGFKKMFGYLGGDYSTASLVASGSMYNSGSGTGALEYGQTFAALADTWTAALSGTDSSSPVQEEDIMASIDDLKNLLVNDVDVRRALAVAVWGGGGAASPMYVARGSSPERSEYPETALFSMQQRINQDVTNIINSAVSGIVAEIQKISVSGVSDEALAKALKSAVNGITITTESK